MRRKPGAVLPLEAKILDTAISLRGSGVDEFHGFLLAKIMTQQRGRAMPAHGTLYRALLRMEKAGWLTSSWEAAETAQAENRPRRRIYQVTTSGEQALARSQARPAPRTLRLQGEGT